MKKAILFSLMSLCLLATPLFVQAQDDDWGELAATLEVISAGVEVNRVNTVNWIPVNVEAIVGVGDTVRTDENGVARITYFSDGVETEIQPGSEYVIESFEASGEKFNLTASILLGQSIQRISRVLDADSNYDLFTPGMELTVRGTEFHVRVEPGGRSAALVYDGTTYATAEQASAEIPASYGIRSGDNGTLSDVVLADDFAMLDSSIDGCAVEVRTPDDVQLNVRLGPSQDFSLVGTIEATVILRFMGTSEAGDWYRIEFREGFGWVLASDFKFVDDCAGLRVFPDTYIEDPTLYVGLGEVITLDDLVTDMPEEPPADNAPSTDDAPSDDGEQPSE